MRWRCLAQPVLANGAFALIQIALGLGILSRRFSRVALGASIVWALSVWFVGEGIGGLGAGATLLTGAPGAALLYAVIAVLAWPTRSLKEMSGPRAGRSRVVRVVVAGSRSSIDQRE